MSDVATLTAANWDEQVMRSLVPVLVDFSAEWCGACQQFKPTLGKLATTLKGRVLVGSLDADSDRAISQRATASRRCPRSSCSAAARS